MQWVGLFLCHLFLVTSDSLLLVGWAGISLNINTTTESHFEMDTLQGKNKLLGHYGNLNGQACDAYSIQHLKLFIIRVE